jgi:hypothetical protein
MEVSSLRDRRLVALFATVVIVGAGATAAVVELGGIARYGGLPLSEAALAPDVGEPQLPVDPPPVVVVVREDPSPEPPPVPRSAPAATPAPPPSEPSAPPVVKVDTNVPRPTPRRSADVVIASESELSADSQGALKLRHNGNDADRPRHDDAVATGSDLELQVVEAPVVELQVVELPVVEPPVVEPPRGNPARGNPPRDRPQLVDAVPTPGPGPRPAGKGGR